MRLRLQPNRLLYTEASMSRPGNTVDERVGAQMQCERIAVGMSREQLAVAMSASVAQIDMWESGRKRIGARRLLRMSAILSVSPHSFFEFDPRQSSVVLH